MKPPSALTLTILGLILTVLGLGMTTLGTIMNWRKANSDLENITKTNNDLTSRTDSLQQINVNQSQKLDTLEKYNHELINTNNKQSEDLSKLREANTLLSKELIASTKELTNQITGGDEYAWISFSEDKLKKRINVSAIVEINGQYNMNAVRVGIYKSTLDQIESENIFSVSPLPFDFDNPVFSKNHGELPLGSLYKLGTFQVPQNELNYYRVRVFAKNGAYSINVKLYLDKGKWNATSAIFERGTNKFKQFFKSK